MQGIAFFQFIITYLREEITRVQHFEEQLVTLLAIFPHQRTEGFHRGRLYLLEAVELIHLLDGVEDIVALRHFHRRKVACSFRYTWFLCHYLRTIV